MHMNAYDVDRLDETFGQGSLPSDAAVSKSIKAASKRKNWTNDYAQGNDRGPSGMPGYNLGRRDAMEAARARQSTPVAAELWRNLHATRMIRQEMEALTNALALLYDMGEGSEGGKEEQTL